jgi:hypothetical protein
MRAILIAASAAAFMSTVHAVADDENEYILDITQIEVKLGHHMQFREGVKAYMACYAQADGENTWSTWQSMDGKGIVYQVVSRMDGWADLDDADDEARSSCASTVRDQIQPHMASVNTMYAKRMAAWSADEDSEADTVVRLHNFSVDDNQKFQAAIGTVTSILKTSESEDPGTWFRVQGGGKEDPEYFVASGYKSFAEMDEERAGPYGTMEAHAGEETAELVWDQYLDSLEDGDSYWSNLLRYDAELSTGDD